MERPDELYYEYNTKGYMLYYRGKPIGGGGIDKYAKGCRANLSLFRTYAEVDKREILSGRGQKRYLDLIEKIDADEEEEAEEND